MPRKKVLIKTGYPSLEKIRKTHNMPKWRAWNLLVLLAENRDELEKERKRLRMSKSKAWDTLRSKIRFF
ncbi:MAG: hypothetical protein HYW77_01515 [Parcubacteria group bacterium]|nr:hypothetical protein [Parcubacteria group bacterium]